MIPYGRQTVDESDASSVLEVLRSRFLTQGPKAEEFEEALSAYTGARYAVVCSTGTAALHLACLAASIGPGDRAVTTPLTFVATPNSVLYAGGEPVFADVDPETGNIDPAVLEEKLEATPGVKAVLPVHFSGLPCRMEEIRRIADRFGLVVIEDACHALGASYRRADGSWARVGSSEFSEMTVLSFHPVKSITTGEGGAVLTNDRKLYERIKRLKSHGITKDPSEMADRDGSDSPWYYEMQDLGFNYRITDFQCALGISQLSRLDSFIGERERIARAYDVSLSRYRFLKTPPRPDGLRSSHHLYPARIDFDGLGVSKKAWFRHMFEAGVSPQVHYIPVHLQPYYRRRFGTGPGDLPFAEKYYSMEVSLPIFPGLKDEDAAQVCESVISSLACASADRAALRAGYRHERGGGRSAACNVKGG